MPAIGGGLVANNRIPDLAADRIRHTHCGAFAGLGYETDSQRPALAPTGWCGEKCELPSGSNPTRHARLRPLVRGDPCCDGPLGWHDQHGFAYERENRGS